MIPLGMALVWGGYTLALYGWVCIRGYNVSFGKLVSPTNYESRRLSDWPKIHSDYTGILPGGKNPATSSASSGGPPPPGVVNT